LCAVQNETGECVLCAVQNETELGGFFLADVGLLVRT
jgi:hypothetical protein